MSKPIIGLVDYGAGNCASVKRLISKLGYRSRLIDKPEDFELISVLFIPGVGAFPSAMNSLKEMKLVREVSSYYPRGVSKNRNIPKSRKPSRLIKEGLWRL